MSVKYIPVQWNNTKWGYDAVLIALAGLYLYIFMEHGPGLVDHDRPITPQIHNARAFGSAAFLMLTVILCIGPLARLDTRFLPLLYNRRHFGVLTCIVALVHFGYILDWYFAFSPKTKLEGLLTANTAYVRLIGFPFETLGLFALLVLIIMAVTSHDFWLKFLTPRLWKRLHVLLYFAYAAVIAHVALGALQDQSNAAFASVTIVCGVSVGALHLVAARRERSAGDAAQWVGVAAPADIEDGFARVVHLGGNERAAVFRSGDRFSAISNACAHQNGPLGEGRIIDGCVTCPWHGFQYRVTDGRSPHPFTEKVPTYRLRLNGGMIEIHNAANPPGTMEPPLIVRGLAQ